MKKIIEYLTARNEIGIKLRLWMAMIMSVAALLVNVFYIAPEYDRLPQVVPLFFDMFGEIAEWGHKSMLNDYAEIRIVFFIIMVIIAWALCRKKGNNLLGKRIRLLVVDIANLVITTGISMTLVYIEIAHGTSTEKLSEHWEYTVMFIGLLFIIIEYVTDKKHLK